MHSLFHSSPNSSIPELTHYIYYQSIMTSCRLATHSLLLSSAPTQFDVSPQVEIQAPGLFFDFPQTETTERFLASSGGTLQRIIKPFTAITWWINLTRTDTMYTILLNSFQDGKCININIVYFVWVYSHIGFINTVTIFVFYLVVDNVK